MLSTDIYLNFKTGLDKYAGLFELAQGLGVIIGSKTYELEDGTKLGYRKQFERDPTVWEETILPILEPKIKNEYRFSGVDTTEEE